MPELNMPHFEELRARINAQLEVLETPHRRQQIDEYSWLYGALGAVPSEYMLIAMNPSLTGVENADIETPDGGEPDIETQWWGGRDNKAAQCLRKVLVEMGLKTTGFDQRGGWNCYLTNVVKEMNISSDQQEASGAEWNEQVLAWGEILAWEIEKVQPRYVFALGGKTQDGVKLLEERGLIPALEAEPVWHYSAYRSPETIRYHMRKGIRRGLGRDSVLPEAPARVRRRRSRSVTSE